MGLQFQVKPMALSYIRILNGNPLPTASGLGYSVQMLVAGGTPPYTWTLVEQTGPDTFTLTAGGLLQLTAASGFEFGISGFGTGAF